MSTRDRLTVAAAVAVALASASLIPVFDGLGWLLRVLLAVAVVAGASSLARRAGLPRVLAPVAGALGLLAYVCFVFARSTLSFGIVPDGGTLRALGTTIGQGLLDVEELAPPVPTNPGLVLLAVLGVGAIAVVVDLVAVTLRQAAIAGLPLLLLFAVPAAVLPGGLGWWPFALGAAGWLGLLLADGSDAVSRWGTPLRPAGRGPVHDPSLNRVGRRIGAAALGVAVFVPALVPGLDGRLLGGGAGGGGLGGSRTTTTYNPILELGGQLQLPAPRLLMTYQTDDPSPDYLRLTTLDTFTEEAGWSSSELSADLQDDAVQDGIPEPLDSAQAARDRYRTSIAVGRIDGPWLPTTFTPTRIDVEGPWLWDEDAETVFSTRTSLRAVNDVYTVDSARVRPSAELLRSASRVPSDILDAYAQPPALSPYVQQLLDRTVDGKDTDYDKVAAIQALFRDEANGFSYNDDADADLPGFNQAGALERFLRGKQGFCEQYASAMGALVRALGIPARVAVGFTPGSRRTDGTYQVTTSDAHAWPEVWFAGAGWVRFEPTPRVSQVTTPGYTQPPADAPVTDDPAAAPAEPTAPETAAPSDPGAVDRGDDLAQAAGTQDDGGLSRRAVVALSVAAGALVLMALPCLLAALRRRRRWASPGPLTAWAQVRDDAVDVGHTWRAADSPRAAAAHLVTARSLSPAAADALGRLASAAERARYARPGSAGADAPELAADVHEVRAALLAGASRREALLARFAPPSTLRWASAGLGAAVADALDRFDALVSAIGERVRHPRALRRRTAG